MNNFNYQLIDSGDGLKLEYWGDFLLVRPDPQAIWPRSNNRLWNQADAIYHRSNKGGGHWQYLRPIPEFWTINYQDLTFKVSPTNFKHTGIFPEQAKNWELIINTIKNSPKKLKVLNLFAYTGCASMCAAWAGAEEVVHLDASKSILNWAKENMQLSNLTDKKIRFINDDALKFMKRELRRGNKYDIIIMDPPSYGRGPNNELFKFEDQIVDLIKHAYQILSDDFKFLLLSTYTTSYNNICIENIFRQTILKHDNNLIIKSGINQIIDIENKILPCGNYSILTRKEVEND